MAKVSSEDGRMECLCSSSCRWHAAAAWAVDSLQPARANIPALAAAFPALRAINLCLSYKMEAMEPYLPDDFHLFCWQQSVLCDLPKVQLLFYHASCVPHASSSAYGLMHIIIRGHASLPGPPREVLRARHFLPQRLRIQQPLPADLARVQTLRWTARAFHCGISRHNRPA